MAASQLVPEPCLGPLEPRNLAVDTDPAVAYRSYALQVQVLGPQALAVAEDNHIPVVVGDSRRAAAGGIVAAAAAVAVVQAVEEGIAVEGTVLEADIDLAEDTVPVVGTALGAGIDIAGLL